MYDNSNSITVQRYSIKIIKPFQCKCIFCFSYEMLFSRFRYCQYRIGLWPQRDMSSSIFLCFCLQETRQKMNIFYLVLFLCGILFPIGMLKSCLYSASTVDTQYYCRLDINAAMYIYRLLCDNSHDNDGTDCASKSAFTVNQMLKEDSRR